MISFRRMSPARIILLGFAGIILLGALLLMLPVSTRDGQGASFIDALFTATSATCVTGLVVHDTYQYWTPFGQFVILMLIQIGGMGVITIAIAFAILSGRKIGLRYRIIMQEAISAPQMGGILRMTTFLIRWVLIFESIGALLLAIRFVPRLGWLEGLWNAVFSSISAFCNAGFDLMGRETAYSSLVGFVGDPLINLTICALIIIGGIGFFVWHDIREKRLDFVHYSLQSKLVICTTLILLVLPTAFFYFLEFHRPEWRQVLNPAERFWAALFQAVTPRTAGFNTVDLTRFSDSSVLVTIMLMLIGGSPSSTAGGFKTTTIAILCIGINSILRNRSHWAVFKRELPPTIILRAMTVFFLYLGLFVMGVIVILAIEPFSVRDVMFEVASAIATVGLTLGITGKLSLASHLILIGLMYFGRVGALTILFSFSWKPKSSDFRYPKENVTVG